MQSEPADDGMKPFLLLATRPEDEAADDEYGGFLRAGGLAPRQLRRVRLESAPMPAIGLDEFSGIIVGGSPFNASDPSDIKTDVQRRVERQLGELLDEVVARDFPFFGACYGIGLVASHLDGVVDGRWAEAPGPTRVTLTAEGLADPLFGVLSPAFDAYVGHKEACSVLPEGGVMLATGPDCPVQAFRVGRNVYATQFHPELTRESLITRLRIYRNHGYFDPSTVDDVIATAGTAAVTEPPRLVKAFIDRFSS
ncbi:glutamine amidotransferase [Glaciibacter sp. 2TAF33]|uniref:glutamine amidotransferase n=1 Tax=Glaciibacter sp. 2TAF33 TaxID=3233015 RepID=UPI003F8DE2C7